MTTKQSSDYVLPIGFRLEHLPALVHAGLEVDVMGAAKLARILVLDIGRFLQRVGRAAHPALRRRGLSFRDSHGVVLLGSFGAGRPDVIGKAGLIEDRYLEN